nr:ImmA/IrrE family metallo-endopeptidase [Longimicrobium terrae]
MKASGGADGYLEPSRIAADKAAWSANTNRYRFTLAHELGHRILHPDFLSSAAYRTESEYLAFQRSLLEADLRRYEWQANCFAGNILLPAEPLAEQVREGISVLRPAGHALDLCELHDCERLARWIATQARVSLDVVMRRATEEGHWVSFR